LLQFISFQGLLGLLGSYPTLVFKYSRGFAAVDRDNFANRAPIQPHQQGRPSIHGKPALRQIIMCVVDVVYPRQLVVKAPLGNVKGNPQPG
jgi:hypothetical protein